MDELYKNSQWLSWTQKLQAIAQTGLAYSRDVYDQERFEELRSISVQIMSAYSGFPQDQVRTLFAGESGYATPKVDVRGVAFRDNRILLVRETLDGLWSIPGGWADIGYSPREIAVKELKEESGFDVSPVRLLAVLDRDRHDHPPHAHYIYKMFILCEIIGGEVMTGTETTGVGFFAEDELPPLSTDRVTESQIRLFFRQVREGDMTTVFD
ncbi:NUDIX hydrolase [Paenibacillus filicis]|uniref:NUDIX hydrolase n=1 Tax=Paenibacillus filicis TaxID=669464 RepID=A0ABU9DYE3_9BACL